MVATEPKRLISVVRLPHPPPEVSANARVHWTAKARAFRTYKYTCGVLIRETLLTRTRAVTWDHATVAPTFVFGTKRRRDLDNLAASLKACGDALVWAGVVPDDDAAHVTWEAPVVVVDPTRPAGVELRLTLTEASHG